MAQLAPEYEFIVEWHAFELAPDHSGAGEPILPALARTLNHFKYAGVRQIAMFYRLVQCT